MLIHYILFQLQAFGSQFFWQGPCFLYFKYWYSFFKFSITFGKYNICQYILVDCKIDGKHLCLPRRASAAFRHITGYEPNGSQLSMLAPRKKYLGASWLLGVLPNFEPCRCKEQLDYKQLSNAVAHFKKSTSRICGAWCFHEYPSSQILHIYDVSVVVCGEFVVVCLIL